MRFLQGTRAWPVPAGGLFVHLELAPLRRGGLGPRVASAVWEGLRVESVASGLLGAALRRCGVDAQRDARAVSLVQPVDGRPDSHRVVVLWGLLAARRLVMCLGDGVEAVGGAAVTLPTGGEPALALDRNASDLHLDVVALDGETLLVAAGVAYRAQVRGLLAGQGAALAASPRYQRAVASAPAGTVLLGLAPRPPRTLPHVPMAADVTRSLRGVTFLVRLLPGGLRVDGALEVAGAGRAARWARRLPGRAGRVAPFLPADQRPWLRRVRPSSAGDVLGLRLDVPGRDLASFGRFVERWLPW